ncbi:hypothetical protein D0544_16355 [Aestuariirhabdus litorea]|uniref:Uncharacterized protein n=2 Tax=Aestuariirhabdus litorea TaxID=2528527 RepID=A0A3P3VN97_9GAMM|nr:hypothetical protein D0544_16355 [Aestuariirhabdus litorea]
MGGHVGFRQGVLLLLLLGLVACDAGTEGGAAAEPQREAELSSEAEPNGVAEPTQEAETIREAEPTQQAEPGRETEPTQASGPSISRQSEESKDPRVILDLSLPRQAVPAPGELKTPAAENLLPDLFGNKKEENKSPASLGGKLLIDRSNPDAVDAVEGAELSIEIKTQ